MSKKIPLAVAIALILVFSALTVLATVSVYLRTYTKSMLSIKEQKEQYALLSEVEALVQSNFDGKINVENAGVYTAKGYVEGLGDKNSLYLTASEYADYLSSFSGIAQGTGISAQFSTADNIFVVTAVAAGSSAADRQIAVGDRILAVNNKDVSVKNYTSLLKVLQSNGEKEVRVKVLKAQAGADPAAAVTLLLNPSYQQESVSFSAAGNIGYIRISAFYDNSSRAFSNALAGLGAQGVNKLILDVRNNSSTNYDAAAEIIDMLVPIATEGTRAIATAKNAAGETVKSYASDTASISLPVAVLVNDRTQGAAELLSADLRDFLNAAIVGERTAGNAGLQQTYLLADGSALILTVAKIYPYITDCYDNTGIVPDVELLLPDFQKDALESLPLSEDAQYNAAVAALAN